MGKYVLRTNIVEYEQFTGTPEQIFDILRALRSLKFEAFWVEDLKLIYFWSDRGFPRKLEVGDWFRFVPRITNELDVAFNVVNDKEFSAGFVPFPEEEK